MSGRDALGRDRGGRDGADVRFPPPLAFVAGFLLGLGLESLVPLAGAPSTLAIAAAVIGVGVWLALDGSAMARFIAAKTNIVPGRPAHALVTSGPYRFTRNPMYVGMAFLYVGLALALSVLWALALLPAVLLIVDRRVIAPEERYLEAKFGEQYAAYKRRVRRWL
jgi:protein-S-isoprenylcysteine O-methyltransferase Ste14